MEFMFSISFIKHRDEGKENNLLTVIIKGKFSLLAPVTSTAQASSMCPSSKKNHDF